MTLHRYVHLVSAAGLALIGLALWRGLEPPLPGQAAAVAVFAVALVLAESLPMRFVHGGTEGEITMSSTFALALLIVGGAAIAIAAMAAGALLADVRHRKPAQRIAFNVAQYTISVAASAACIALLTGASFWAPHELQPSGLLAVSLAAGAFFLMNSALVARAVTLAEHAPFWPYLRSDLVLQTTTVGILLGLAPIAVITADFSLAALPLLGLPLFAVYAAGRHAIANQRQALHDALTGLPNRACLEERLDIALRTARSEGTGAAVMLIDLDGFKEVNDSLGHHQGDLLLRRIAGRLREAAGPQDTVARFGGDEFVLVLPGARGDQDLGALALRLGELIERPVQADGQVLQVGSSIGIARFPRDGDDAETLVRRADVAMYRAKESRRGHQLYEADHDVHAADRLRLAADLRAAVREGDLLAHFQPKLRLADGTIEGMEVLLRWPHQERGMVPPSEFVPLAERSGLIADLTRVALEGALREASAWRLAGVEIPFAVNISARSLGDGQLIEEIRTGLARFGLPGRLLQLELTESVLVEDLDGTSELLRSLRSMDVGLSIDDFGTGWSSLAQLRGLPFDEVKIDRSFVSRMQPGGPDEAIVRSTVELAHELGLRVVAEGVETVDVLERLRELGCDTAQGYLIGRPAPSGALARRRELWVTPAPTDARARLAA